MRKPLLPPRDPSPHCPSVCSLPQVCPALGPHRPQAGWNVEPREGGRSRRGVSHGALDLATSLSPQPHPARLTGAAALGAPPGTPSLPTQASGSTEALCAPGPWATAALKPALGPRSSQSNCRRKPSAVSLRPPPSQGWSPGSPERRPGSWEVGTLSPRPPHPQPPPLLWAWTSCLPLYLCPWGHPSPLEPPHLEAWLCLGHEGPL